MRPFVRPFARSFPFGMKMRKGGNFGRSLVKSTKFGTHRSTLSVAAMTATRRRKLECGTALCKLQSRRERHSPQSPKGSPRILQQKNRRVSPTWRETSRRFQLSNQTPQRSSQSPSVTQTRPRQTDVAVVAGFMKCDSKIFPIRGELKCDHLPPSPPSLARSLP